MTSARKELHGIAGELRRRIMRGHYGDGQLLPTPAELMLEFRTSRATVTKCIDLLRSQFLVASSSTSINRVVVRAPDASVAAQCLQVALSDHNVAPTDILHAVASIESSAVVMLAELHDPRVVDRLSSAIASARTFQHDRARLAQLQKSFHALILEQTGNQTLKLFAAMLWCTAKAGTNGDGRMYCANEKALAAANCAHETVVELIANGDTTRVGNIWRDHILADETCCGLRESE
jgi:DNA-binding FadR family transcriptional regulator